MCGIAGFYGNGNENTLLKMAECLKHRGPDSRGYFFDENLKMTKESVAYRDSANKEIIIEGELGFIPANHRASLA